MRTTYLAFSLLLFPGLAAAENIVYPADANVANVQTYGAKGDGVTDDTAAIQAALNANAGTRQLIYFPNGTYLISSTLALPLFNPYG